MARIAASFRPAGTRSRAAQGMTEYIIVVSLVAIACITAVTVYGHKIAQLFQSATKSLDEGKPRTAPSQEFDGLATVRTDFTLGDVREGLSAEDPSGGTGSAPSEPTFDLDEVR